MRFAIWCLAFVLCAGAPVLTFVATPATAAEDVSAAQSVIRSQLEAMDRDDAAAAYSFAAPEIRGLFSEADSFMAMVRRSYQPVHRHKSYSFGDGRGEAGRFIQEVRIIDSDGVPWQAIYTLEQQPDGSLKITGCTLKAIGTPA